MSRSKEGETKEQRSQRVLNQLRQKYPDTKVYDLDGRGLHFLSEVEPVTEHPEFDRAVEVIISSKPHKHLKMTQYYTILHGILNLYVDDELIILKQGDKYTVEPEVIHWAESDNECWVEIYSEPGWTEEDHIVVSQEQIK